jgi:hypothetical protein
VCMYVYVCVCMCMCMYVYVCVYVSAAWHSSGAVCPEDNGPASLQQ